MTDPRQARHASMNTVSTKPVRHRFGKVSTEEGGQAHGDGGRCREPLWSCIAMVVSEESAGFLRGDLTTSPEVRGWHT